MSGPICPDCRHFDIREDRSKDPPCECLFCGWKGGLLPRKALSSEMYQRIGDRHRMEKKAREEGTLLFVRVYVEGDDLPMEFKTELMLNLGVSGMGGVRGNPPYLFFMVHHPFDEPTLQKLESMKGVKKIVVT